MAIFKAGAVVAAVSGKVGGQVFVQSSRGNVLRQSPKQLHRDTQAQLAQRASLTRWNAAWRTITEQQRNAWRAAARTRLFPNRLGTLREISGFNLYVKYNGIYDSIGLPPLTIPPRMETTVFSPLTSFTYTTIPFPTLELTWSANDQFFSKYIRFQIRPSSTLQPLNEHWVYVLPDLVGPFSALYYTNILSVLGTFISGNTYWALYQATDTNKLPTTPQMLSRLIP